GRQRPETYISLLSEYYLNQSDRVVWDRIKDQDDVAALRDFANKYPSSPLAIIARNKVEVFERYAKEREEADRRAREADQRERRRAEQLGVQKRIEEEQKRQEALRQQQDEQKRQEALRQQQDEQKRQEALRQQQDEEKRQEALRQQQDEQKRVAALQQQEEQKRQEALRQQIDLDRRRIEENCRREEARLAELKAGGAAAREQLVKFEIEAGCKALRPMIAAAIENFLPNPPVAPLPPSIATPPASATRPQIEKVNLPEQIHQAQIELRRLGCFEGKPDSKMNGATEKAVKAFWSHSRRPIIEINITD